MRETDTSHSLKRVAEGGDPLADQIKLSGLTRGRVLQVVFRRAPRPGPEVTALRLTLAGYGQYLKTFETDCRLAGDQVFECEIHDSRVSTSPSGTMDTEVHLLTQVRLIYTVPEGPSAGTYVANYQREDAAQAGCPVQEIGEVQAGDLGTFKFPPLYVVL